MPCSMFCYFTDMQIRWRAKKKNQFFSNSIQFADHRFSNHFRLYQIVRDSHSKWHGINLKQFTKNIFDIYLYSNTSSVYLSE